MSVKNNASKKHRAAGHPLSHKVASVAASALLVWSMWPTGALAEVQKELTAAQEEAIEQPAQVEDDAEDVAVGADVEKTAEADIVLEFISSTITYAGQVIAAPTSKVKVPTTDDFKFTAAANTGFELAEVSISVNGSDRRELDPDANGTYTISAADIAQGVTLCVESEKPADAATDQVMAADVVDENTQIASVSDAGTISGPTSVAQRNTITITYNGDMTIDNWYGGDGLFSGWEVSSDKKSLTLTATSNWAFNGSSKTTTIYLGYIDNAGAWHTGTDGIPYQVTVKKRTFTVVQPEVKAVGEDCFWLPQIKDDETGEIINLTEAPSGSFCAFEYYYNGQLLEGQNQYWHNADLFKQAGSYKVVIKPNSGWIYDFGDQSQIEIVIPTEDSEDNAFDGAVTGNDTLEVGKFAPYVATGFSGDVTWTTSDPSIATVDSNGVLTAVAEGTVEVIATHGTEVAKKAVEVTKTQSSTGKYNATIVPTIENADVAYFAWHDESDTDNIAFTKVSGTVTINDYTTSSKPGYVIFLVKPNDNHIITGLGAAGNGDIYAVDATSWGNINGYPNMAKVMAAAKAAGYVATFGWYRGAGSSLNADFQISAKSPDMTVTAVSDRTQNVVAGDELTFTVTITPQTTGSGKDSVTGVHVNSAEVNGNAVEVENLTQNSDGTFTGTVHYTATDADCSRGSVALTVNATSTYSGAYTISSGDIASTAAVTKAATATCKIAPEATAQYKFVSGTAGKTLPSAIYNYLPWDNVSYSGNTTVKAKDPEVKEYADAGNDGYWTFTGWDQSSKKTDRYGNGVTFTGTWTFTQYSKYTIKYVDEKGNELLASKIVSGNKVGDKIKVSDVEKPTIAGYTYSKASTSNLKIAADDSQNVITLTYKQKTGKAGYYLVLGDASWTAPDDTTKESDAQKWYYNYGFALNDTFAVTDSVPSAENHVFIGWMDKERDGQAAAIRKADDTVTYCYANNKTYTLDALWASLSATGADVTYDGQAHGLSVDVGINEGTGLDEKYVEQAKDLIAAGAVYYSIDDGDTWTTTAPSYTDAGEYPVKVKQDVTVGGVTTTLTAETTIKIAPKTYYVKTNTDSKAYDGAVLAGTATVEGLVSGESATATATTIGPDVSASTTNAVTGDIAWGANTKSSNYTRGTDDLGTLEITKRDVALESASFEKPYDGTALTNGDAKLATETGWASGEGATYSFTGSQTKVGESNNSFSYALNSNTKESNYNITKSEGKLKVTDRTERYEVIVSGNEGTFIYDGQSHTVSGPISTTYTNDKGVTFTISGLNFSASGKDAGIYVGTVTGDAKVTDPSGNDVTSQFGVTPLPGQLTISPKAVTITAGSATKEYDGSALTADQANPKYTAEGFVEDEGLDYDSVRVTGSQTEVGSSRSNVNQNFLVPKSNTNMKNYEVTLQPGTLTVTNRTAKYQIELEGVTETKTYNGSGQTMNGVKTDEFEIDGVKFKVKNYKSDVTGKDAGDYTQTITSTNEDGHWTVVDANGNDVSAQFSVTTKAGKLTISPKDVTITSGSDSKTYDGTALTKHEASVTAGGFVEGEEAGVFYTYTGTQTNAGSSKNTFSVNFDGTNAKASNYNVTQVKGDLAVNAVADEVVVTIKGNTSTVKYDGTEQSVTGYTVQSIKIGDEATTLYKESDFGFSGNKTAKGTNASDTVYPMGLKAEQFTNNSTNFTNVRFVVEDGSLIINKREVTLASASDSKTYDGTPLTNSNVAVSGDGFVSGEGASYNVTGTITNCGSVDNDFTYTLNEGTNADNYAITTQKGKLQIDQIADQVTVTITGKTESVKYDGAKHTATGYDVVSIEGSKLYTADLVNCDVAATAERVDAGTTYMGLTEDSFRNTSANFSNVKFIVTDGYVTVAQREVTLTSASDEKYYDGDPLTNNNVTVGGDLFVEGEGATFSVTGSRTLPGTSENAFTYELNAGTKAENYKITATPGSLTVKNRDAKYQITVEANSGTVTYDGKEHMVSGLKQTTFTENGKTYTVEGYTATAVGTDAGTYAVNVEGTPVVKDAEGNVVTDQFEITTKDGDLTINKATVTLKSASDSKTYDGTALTKQEMETNTGWADGEGVDITYTGTITNAGSVDNAYTYTAKSGTNLDNYNTITPEYGTLTVNPVSDKVTVTIAENSDSKVFNNQEQSVEGFTVSTNNTLYTEGCFSFVGDASHKAAKGTNVGTYDMGLVASDFKNTSGNFSNVEFVIVDGQLTITPAELVADEVVWNTTDIQHKYDGTSVAAGTATAKDKFGRELHVQYSADDGKTWVDNPSEITATNHGDSKVIKLRATADYYAEGQYAESRESLSITKRTLYFASASASKKFDGTALTRNAQSDVTVTGDGFVGTEGATFDITGTQTAVGNSANAFTHSFNEGTLEENYQVVNKTEGELKVTDNDEEVVLFFSGEQKTYVYDGQYHYNNDADSADAKGWTYDEILPTDSYYDEYVKSNNISDDQAFTYTGDKNVKGKDAGTYTLSLDQNKFVNNLSQFTGVGFMVTSDGWVKITAQSIDPNDKDAYKGVTVEAPADVIYNGDEQHQKPVVKDKDGNTLTEGTDYTLSYSEDTTNAGTVTVTVTGIGNYSGTVTRTYKIKQRELTVTTPGASKVYDGAALTAAGGWAECVTGYVTGESAAFETTGSRTEQGSSDNTYAIDWNAEGNTAKQGNYTITSETLGQLVVTRQSIVPVPDPDAYKGVQINSPTDVTYDAAEHKWAPTVTDAEGNVLTEGADYTVSYSTADFTNAGTITVTITGTGSYAGTVTRAYNINKRAVTLTSESKAFTYNGKAQSWSEYTCSDDLFASQVDGLGCTASVTNVGDTATNAVNYTFKTGFSADNYDITTQFGTLSVKNSEDEIVVTTTGGTWTYDGQAHGATVSVSMLPKGYTLVEAKSSASETDVTSADGKTATADTLKIVNANGDDVTSSLKITYNNGTIVINPATLTVTTPDATKVYDGTALSAAGSYSGLVNGETIDFTTTGSQTEVGESDNGYKIAWTGAKSNNYVISETIGKLSVTKQSIDPGTDPDNLNPDYSGVQVGTLADVVYNGQYQEQKPTVTDKDGKPLVEGTDYKVTFSTDTKNAGAVTVTIEGQGNYSGTVTRTYNITKRPVTIQSGSATKVFDGFALTKHEASVTSATGIVEGESLAYSFTGSQTAVGGKQNNNTFSVNWDAAATTAAEGNYDVSYVYGTLIVTGQSIVPGTDEEPNPSYKGVTVNDPTDFKYDAANHQWVPEVKDADDNALIADTDYTISYKRNGVETTDFKNVGAITVTITGIGNYTGSVTKEYQITKRQVTLTSDSGDKKYDGKAIQRHGVTVGGDGFAAGENVSENYTWYDSDFILPNTEGYVNQFDYVLKDGTLASNYEITKVYGNLKVYKADAKTNITLTVSDRVETYDGNTYTLPAATATVSYNNTAKIEYSLDGQTWTEDASSFSATNVSDSKVVSVRASSENFDGYVYGTAKLTINKRDVTITSDDGDFVYNGEEQKAESASVTSGSFVGEQGVASYSFSNSVKNVGDSKENVFAYTLKDNTDANNYNITKVNGGLSVRKDANSIVVKLTGYEGAYDGAAHAASGSIAGTLPSGFTYEITSNASITNAGETTAKVDAFVIKDKSGSDVTDQFNVVTTATATLKVTPATLKVVTNGGEKEYDGEALTAAGSITGFANGETAAFTTTGSQTYVGESENGYKIDWNGTADEKNYTVVATLGALKVTEPVDSKVITKTHADGAYGLGDKVTFTITATNIYSEAKTLTITEQEGVSLDKSVFENVAAGASVTATATYTITEADILAGSFKNTATVSFSGTDKTYSAEDTVTVDEAAAKLAVTKTTTSTPANGSTYALGETISYKIVVKNEGNLTVNNVKVNDPNADGFDEKIIESLAPGASAEFEATHVVTESDILAGSVVNTATAKGADSSDKDVDTDGKKEDKTDTAKGKLTVIKTATSEPADGKAYKLGETISYKIVVKNEGNLTVNNVKVNDVNADGFDEKTVDSLAPGESAEFDATHVVTEADIKAGEVVNSATAKGTDSSNKDVDIDGKDTEPTDTPGAALTVTKTAEQNGSAADGAFKLGETINYSITVKNTGNQTVKNITVSDPNADGFGEKTIASLAPGQSETFSATHKVTEADILAGEVVNIATAKGTDPDGKDVDGNGTDTKTIDELNTTLGVEKTAAAPADGVSYKLGETVKYTVKVTNNGNVTYKNVKVTDAQTGLNETIDALAVGESRSFDTTHVITEADIAAGSYANVATAKADSITDGNGNKHEVSGEDTETIGGDSADKKIDEGNANLTVTKTVINTGTGANGAFKLGDTIEYGITVTNNGNLTAKNFQVVDNNADGFASVTIESLAPGETTQAITAKHVVTSDDVLAGKVVNVATTTGGYTDDDTVKPNPTPGETETDVDSLDTTLEVTKTAKASASGSYKLGETVEYTVTVTNKGNVPYYNVVVSDAQTGLNETVTVLGVGQTAEFTTTHVIDETDIVAGSYANVATAKADAIKDPATGEDVVPSGQDTETIGGKDGEKPIDSADPKLVITKTSDVAEGTLLKEGDVVNYTVTAKNTGNLTLTNVAVDDQLAGVVLAEGESATIESLAPGAIATLHYSYTVKQSDVVAGKVANHVTATADNPSDKGTNVTPGDKTDPTEAVDGSLYVEKTADRTEDVKVGDVITYTITVLNNGNVDLSGVVVTDELTGLVSDAFDLARGASKTITTAYTVTEADLVAGKVTNVATATATDPKGGDVDGKGETTFITEAVDGALTVEKTAAAGSYAAGDTVTYTIKVTNKGNVTVSGITVADAKTGFSQSDVTLAPGESREFYTTYVVTDADITAGKVENRATADGTDAGGDPVHGKDTNTVDNHKQTDPDNPDEPALKREFTVKNPDDVTYNGASQQQNPVVKDAATGNTLVEGVDYELVYSEDTTNAGTVTVTVTGKGNYTGTGSATYQIKPATLTVTTPNASKAYDGQALLAAGSYSGLVKGETIGFATTGSQTMVGSSDNTYSIEWAKAGILGIGGNGYTAKQSNYTVVEKIGTLTVTDDVDDNAVVAKTHEAGTYGLGDTVTYTITAKNIYDTAKTVIIGEIEGALLEQSVFENVQPGQTVTTTATYVIQEKDILAGKFVNTATVSFSGVDKEYSTDDNTDVDDANPQLTVTKTSDVAADTLLKEGDVVNYTVTVKNNGNLTINNVNVNDQLDGVVLAQGETTQIASLLPGESKDLHFSYTVTQADVVAGKVVNTATATGDNPVDPDEPTPVTPGTHEDHTEKASPSFYIVKSDNGAADVKAGDVIDYTLTVVNNGNVDLTGVVVTDELTGLVSDAFDLARGESKTITTGYAVTAADMVAGRVLNVATGTATDPSGNDVTGDEGRIETTTESVFDDLVVEKTAAAGSYAAGDTVKYTIKVTNKGNVTVSGITVADAKTGFGQPGVTLAPGESREFYTTYVVTDADIAAGSVANRATADGTDAGGDPVHGEDTNTVDNHKQTDPDNPDDSTLKRAFTVENPEDVTYNGREQEQKPVVKDADGNELVEGVDYELVYSEDTTNVGTVTVTVKGKGNYTGELDATYQIHPAVLTVVTGSASKAYDGSALTNSELTLTGLVGGDYVVASTTGSQTEVGTSVNTYAIDWRGAKAGNYTIVEELGSLTVTEAVPTPTPDSTPDNNDGGNDGGNTPTPTPAPVTPEATVDELPAPLDAVAEALETVADAATGEPAANGETIYDEANPLGTTHNSCWVHFWMFVGMVVTAIYGLAVWLHRTNHTRKLRKNMNDLLGGNDEGSNPIDVTNPAGTEA